MFTPVKSKNPCPVCGGHEWEILYCTVFGYSVVLPVLPIIPIVDKHVVNYRLYIDRCLSCDTMFTAPEPYVR